MNGITRNRMRSSTFVLIDTGMGGWCCPNVLLACGLNVHASLDYSRITGYCSTTLDITNINVLSASGVMPLACTVRSLQSG
jgi:hypothetical protein